VPVHEEGVAAAIENGPRIGVGGGERLPRDQRLPLLADRVKDGSHARRDVRKDHSPDFGIEGPFFLSLLLLVLLLLLLLLLSSQRAAAVATAASFSLLRFLLLLLLLLWGAKETASTAATAASFSLLRFLLLLFLWVQWI
jgi:hypothetical protein